MKPMPDKVWVPMGKSIQFHWHETPLAGEGNLIVTGPAWVERMPDGSPGFVVRKGAPPTAPEMRN